MGSPSAATWQTVNRVRFDYRQAVNRLRKSVLVAALPKSGRK